MATLEHQGRHRRQAPAPSSSTTPVRHRAERARSCTRSSPPSSPPAGPARSPPRPAPRCAAAAPSRGGRRAPAAPAPARAGRRIWRGGGVALGPKPRELRPAHAQEDDPPRPGVGAVRPRRRRAGSSWSTTGASTRPSTKDAVAALGRARRRGPGARRAGPRGRRRSGRASATCPTSTSAHAGELNAYDVLVNDWVVFTHDTLPVDRPVTRRRPTPTSEEASTREGPPRRHHRPVVSEKSYALIEHRASTRSRSHPDASKPEIRDAVEAIFDVKVAQGEHPQPQGQAQAQPQDAFTYGTASRHQAGHRHPRRGRDDRPLPGIEVEHRHGTSQAQAHQPRPTVPDGLRLLRDHHGHARAVAAGASKHSTGGRNNHGRKTARHRAAATSSGTGSSTSSATRTACPRRSPPIEYDPNRNCRIAAAPLPRRREALHPRAPRT